MITLTKAARLRGELTVPGDKSVSHRSVMFGSIARGTTEITGFLQGADCLSTIGCFSAMGVGIENAGGSSFTDGGCGDCGSLTGYWTAATAAPPPG